MPKVCAEYLILNLSSTRLVKCACKDDLQDAIRAWDQRNIPYAVFRYSYAYNCYGPVGVEKFEPLINTDGH